MNLPVKERTLRQDVALAAISHLFGADMRGLDSGVVDRASTAAFRALTYAAMYGARNRGPACGDQPIAVWHLRLDIS